MKPLFAIVHSFRDATRSLWAYRLRTLLTGLGVTVGVATVIAILAIIEGLNVSFRDQVSAMGTGTLYVSQTPWIVLGDWWKFVKRPKLVEADADWLEERIVRARAVVPFADARATVEVGRVSLDRVRVIGSTASWPEMSGLLPAEGRFFAPGDGQAAREVVAVGFDVARALSEQGVSIGDKIRIGDRSAQVIGSFAERGQMFGRSQDDFVVIPLTVFERWFGTRRSLSIGVVVEPEELEVAEDEIIGAMRAKRALRAEDEDNFSINQQQMFVELYETLTKSLFATAIGLGVITLIVGGVGIMNIMLVAVAERTKEIGIRKALGARPAAIMLQFVVEASVVSGVGGALGSMLGLALGKLVASLTPLPASAPSIAVPAGLAFGIAVGLLFGFMPAWRASRLVPVVALGTGS